MLFVAACTSNIDFYKFAQNVYQIIDVNKCALLLDLT